MTEYVDPHVFVRGELVTETALNAIQDNIRHLKEQQGAQNQFFRGVQLGTHPNADLAPSQVHLSAADLIIMSDGIGVEDWPVLTADLTGSGAGGLDTGTEQVSTWYEVHAIRKSLDGTRGLLLHAAPEYFTDEEQAGFGGTVALRDASARTNVAQGFQTDESAPIVLVPVQLQRVGSPTGEIYLTIESDAAGSPSGVVLAESDKLNVANVPTTMQWVMFPFREPFTATAGTQYHLRYNGSFSISGANYVNVGTDGADSYARGQVKTFDGSSTWTGVVDDATFAIIVFRNETDLVLPSGYDESCLIGYAYNNTSGNFRRFDARDRLVTYLESWQMFSATLTSATPVDIRVGVPPRPVTLWPAVNTGSGTYVKLAPVPAGFNLSASSVPRNAGSTGVVAANNHVVEVGPLHTQIYCYGISDGLATAYLSTWQWW